MAIERVMRYALRLLVALMTNFATGAAVPQVASVGGPLRAEEANSQLAAGNAYLHLAGSLLTWKATAAPECQSARRRIQQSLAKDTPAIHAERTQGDDLAEIDTLQQAEEKNLNRLAIFSAALSEAVRAKCFAKPVADKRASAGSYYIPLTESGLPWRTEASDECRSARQRLKLMSESGMPAVQPSDTANGNLTQQEAFQRAEENALRGLTVISSILYEAVRAGCLAEPAIRSTRR